jgi:hypothetical protein
MAVSCVITFASMAELPNGHMINWHFFVKKHPLSRPLLNGKDKYVNKVISLLFCLSTPIHRFMHGHCLSRIISQAADDKGTFSTSFCAVATNCNSSFLHP